MVGELKSVFSNDLCDDYRFEMDSSEARLDRIEAQRSMDVSHDQRKGRYFLMNLINKVARKLCSRGSSQSGGDGATPAMGDTESLTTSNCRIFSISLVNLSRWIQKFLAE